MDISAPLSLANSIQDPSLLDMAVVNILDGEYTPNDLLMVGILALSSVICALAATLVYVTKRLFRIVEAQGPQNAIILRLLDEIADAIPDLHRIAETRRPHGQAEGLRTEARKE